MLIQNMKLLRIEKDHALPMIGVAVATTAILYSSYKLIFNNNNNRKKNQGFKDIPIPGSNYPLVGHMMSLGELPGYVISKWHQELGPIIQLHMGCQTWIVIDCPSLAHKVLVTCGAETSYRPHSVYTDEYYSMKGKGMVFAQPKVSWKKCRTASLSVLAPKEINKHIVFMQKESCALVDRLINNTASQGSVDPLKYFELNALNVIFELCFNKRFDSINDPEFEEVEDMVKTSVRFAGLESDTTNFFPFLSVLDYFIGKQAKMRQFIYGRRNPFFRQLIKEAAVKEGTNMIKLLEEMNCNLTEDETIVLMFDLTIGGMDPLSVTLSWTVALLCHYPNVQENIFAEIDGFIRAHNRLPNFKDRNDVPYCVSVMKECMRYKPVTPFGLAHSVQQDLEVDGYVIPKGSVIITNMDSMHKNPERFPQGEQFIPERFMSNLKTMQSAANGKLENRDHFNFGWGRRLCPAIYMSEVEFFTSFVEIFARCSIKPATELQKPDIEGAVNAGLIIAPPPFKVKFLKRVNTFS